ncbi:ArsR/SmtB family transcription factor [Longispora albida]|uniref:ArsR/SmtB family transcription factor n=1 Tax=Longispora albida TaxID=203523 RepID=UPI0003762DE3|nr:metalloregulator ArsR/SmtB family transcription factor [Longispora albida]
MSKQGPVLTLTPVAAEACCTPLSSQAVSAEAAADLAPAFKALGDPVRLRLLSMIASADDGEICVCDLTPAFDLSGPTISHHLKSLREAGLIEGDRRGTWVWYRAVPEKLAALSALLNVGTFTAARAQ